jgi:triosephosphate isomerase
MQGFIVSVLIKVLTDPKVMAQIEKLIGNIVAKQILPVVPVAIGGAVKTALDELIAKTPGISGVVDVVKTTESAAASIVDLIPGLGTLPIIGDLLNSWK